MIMMNKIIKYTIGLAVLLSFMMISCTDDNVGEFTLTGNIEHLVPENSYYLKRTNTSDGKYIVFTPILDSGFEYWGLTLKGVEYYIDGTLYSIEQNLPCELILLKDDMQVGTHELLAKMTILGAACDELVVEKGVEFNISASGDITEHHGDFYFDYNYVSKGDFLVITPELLVNRSSSGCEIDEVKYYWDGALISTELNPPFSLNYQVNDETGSKHSIKATVYYHDAYNSKLTYNWTFSGYKVYAEDYGCVTWDIKSSRNDYVNGETLLLTAKLFKGDNVKKKFEVEFYLDEKLIGKSSSFPYTLEHKLTGLSVGTHTVTGRCYEKENDGYVASSNNETIIITK